MSEQGKWSPKKIINKSLCRCIGHKAKFSTCADAGDRIHTCARCNKAGIYPGWIDRVCCWWFGCRPIYCVDNDSGTYVCARCGIEGIENMQLDADAWDSRHDRIIGFMRYWLFRKWWPYKCSTCGKRPCHFQSDDCLPF